MIETTTKKDKVIAKVMETYDYSKFKELKGNRNLDVPNLKRITQSMKENPLFSIITVNKDFEIIDGRHRFTACKELKLPIYYVICDKYTLKEVQILNTNSKNWNNISYLNSYCALGYAEYIKVKNFMSKYPYFTITLVLHLLSLTASRGVIKARGRSGYNVDTFKNGNYKCVNIDKSEEIATQLIRLRMVTDLYNRRSFVNAYLIILRSPNFSQKLFFKKMKTYTGMIEAQTNAKKYVDMFEKIYNFRSRKPVSLKY